MDIYAQLRVNPIINAAGTLTAFGGSLMPAEVIDAMAAASRAFVDMAELHLAAGKRIAELIGVEAAHVCAGAAAGITLMAAACMTGTDLERIRQLPDTDGMRDRLIVQRAHRNPFDQAVRLAGARLVEIAADAEELKGAMDGETAAVYCTFAWFCRGEALPFEQVLDIAHEAGVPVIVDAAAELPPAENLSRFVHEGADLVAFSGGKGIRGPQSSGLILGRKELIEACRLNDNPNMGVGRPMKVGKEEIVGLMKAVEIYLAQDHAVVEAVWERRVAHVIQALSCLEQVHARRQMPYGIGQLVPHVALTWDEKTVGITYQELVQRLRNGRPRIAIQLITPGPHSLPGPECSEIRVHPHTLRDGEEIVVAQRLEETLAGKA
ncbi:MAG TPA: aminotransferase class V-fold PLP-dependent enzyme [Anaerolineae bacterium]|nr:aminotransferase class V-fold PLP-dependent enzyme [Anaerolineae bacterium]